MRSTSRLLFAPSTSLSKHAPSFVSSKTHTVPATRVPGRQFKRGQEGLFGCARVLSGNNIPHSMHKTRRKWYPNAQNKSLYSDILGSMVKVKLTSRVLKSIDKMGGFDHYIQNTAARELGDEGIKWRIILEQHIETGRKAIHPPRTTAETAVSPDETELSDAPLFYSSASSPEEDSTVGQLPPAPPPKVISSNPATQQVSTPGLLFSRDANRRVPSVVPRIPIFSRVLQRDFIKKNIQRSILAARGLAKSSPPQTARGVAVASSP